VPRSTIPVIGTKRTGITSRRTDGASTFALYRRIVIPQLRPAFMSAFVVLAHMAIKSYDLVIALTGGGPGSATELPATFMYSYTFTRNQMGIGASSAVIMLMTIAAIIIPYLWSELREKK
jgi:glucose/mannose transport system permease protein